jgi:hypothetical protein
VAVDAAVASWMERVSLRAFRSLQVLIHYRRKGGWSQVSAGADTLQKERRVDVRWMGT